MRTVNWTSAITQQQGSGVDTIIGLLDATATGDPDIADNVAWSGGYASLVNGHGVGVASLMVAAHDRQGVMGVAPHATVIAYNPFDSDRHGVVDRDPHRRAVARRARLQHHQHVARRPGLRAPS